MDNDTYVRPGLSLFVDTEEAVVDPVDPKLCFM
jgi:hypothetical protein